MVVLIVEDCWNWGPWQRGKSQRRLLSADRGAPAFWEAQEEQAAEPRSVESSLKIRSRRGISVTEW